jgi:tRNA pseudouridine55 synthase
MPVAQFDGLLVIDKPAGWTSHDVVGWTRRWLKQKRVGHAGTLDPAATGVLPVVAGEATKWVQYLTDASKRYVAEITFGVVTDSADADGRVVEGPRAVSFERADLERALDDLIGRIRQRPPMHSALKVDGRRLYDLARQGIEVEVEEREVEVYAAELISWDCPTAVVNIDCSKGTYIRSIARDLGERLGTGAHLSDLVRMRTGNFSLCEAWRVDELAPLEPELCWPRVAVHPDEMLHFMPALLLSPAEAEAWRNGREVTRRGGAESPVRAYSEDGCFLGVGAPSADGTAWRPVRVVADAA